MASLVLLGIAVLIFVGIGSIGGWAAIVRASASKEDLDELKIRVQRMGVQLEKLATDIEAPPGPASDPPTTAAPTAPMDRRPGVLIADDNMDRPSFGTTVSSEQPDTPKESGTSVPPHTAPTAPIHQRRTFGLKDWAANFERVFVANWLVWLGAAALGLGGIFLISYAVEQGFFGPRMRTLAAFVAGLGLIGASEWLRRSGDLKLGKGQIPYAPLAVAAAGLATLYGAAYAAGPLYSLVPPLIALVLFVLACAAAIFLSLLHGPLLAALGLVGAYFAPILAGGSAPAPFLILAYAFAVTLSAMILVLTMNWRSMVWLALAGSGIWGLLAFNWTDLPTGPAALTLYALLLCAVATWFAWSDSEKPLWFLLPNDADHTSSVARDQTVTAGYGFWLLSSVLLFALTWEQDHQLTYLLVYGLFCAAGLWIALSREALALLPIPAATGALLLLLVWPNPDAIGRANEVLIGSLPPAALSENFIYFGLAIALLFGFGGWLALERMRTKQVMAVVSTAVPLGVLFIAFRNLSAYEQSAIWGGLGLGLSILLLVAVETLSRRPGGLDRLPGVASIYVLGAVCALTFAIVSALEQMWISVLLAIQIPVVAGLYGRFRLDALRWFASGLAIIVMVRIVWPPEILGYNISSTIFFNELLVLYGIPLICFWAAARLFTFTADDPKSNFIQALETSAIICFALLISTQIRHMAGGGNLEGTFQGLTEVSAYATSWIILALGLTARLGRTPPLFLGIVEKVTFTAASAIAIIGLIWLYNPLWPIDTTRIVGPVVFNILFTSYVLPAFIFVLYAIYRRHLQTISRAHFAGLIAMALLFFYVTLEVRHGFRGEILSQGSMSDGETYTYSIVWILFSLATLGVGLLRGRTIIRHAAMAVLIFSIGKVFIFDMAALEGVLRAFSFLGLGAVLISVALLYQRVIFRKEAQEGGAKWRPDE